MKRPTRELHPGPPLNQIIKSLLGAFVSACQSQKNRESVPYAPPMGSDPAHDGEIGKLISGRLFTAYSEIFQLVNKVQRGSNVILSMFGPKSRTCNGSGTAETIEKSIAVTAAFK